MCARCGLISRRKGLRVNSNRTKTSNQRKRGLRSRMNNRRMEIDITLKHDTSENMQELHELKNTSLTDNSSQRQTSIRTITSDTTSKSEAIDKIYSSTTMVSKETQTRAPLSELMIPVTTMISTNKTKTIKSYSRNISRNIRRRS